MSTLPIFFGVFMSRLWLLEAVCSVKLPLVGYIDMTILAHHFGIECTPGYREQFEVSPRRGVILKGNPSTAEGPQDTVIRTYESIGHGVIIAINASHVHIVINQHIAGHDVGWTLLALLSVFVVGRLTPLVAALPITYLSFFLDISVIWTKRWSLLDACAASAKVRNCSDTPAIIRNNAATGDVVAVRARGADQ